MCFVIIIMQSFQDLYNDFSNIWELYGVKSNPFSTSPLLVRGGVLPIESFSGRKNEIDRLFKQFRSAGGGRILVVGDVGVGKTTFVNVARHSAIQKGFFSPIKEIAVVGEWTSSDFILNTLAGIYSTIELQKNDVRLLSNDSIEKLKSLVEINSVEKKIVGASVLNVGGDYQEERKTPHTITIVALQNFFEKIVLEIHEKTGKEVIIHYNNLERLPEQSVRKIFEDLRDFFQTPNVHFIFVGNLTVHNIFQSMPRVASIISDTPILLKEMKLVEIEEAINVRLDKLRITDLNVIRPFTPNALNALHVLYNGNIRNILNSLSTAVLDGTREKAIVLTQTSLSKILKEIVEKRYLRDLPHNAKKILLETIKYEEITNKQLSAITKIARPNVSVYIHDLQTAGCLYLRRKDGKDKYWSADPKLKWLLLQENAEEEKQKKMEHYM